MSIDHYALCPCGSGKKIKFCCGDLVHEVEHISTMLAGDQRIAAFRYVERLVKKHPKSPALLTILAEIGLELEKFEQAEFAINTLLALQPKKSSAFGMQAQLYARENKIEEACDALQNACDLREGDMQGVVHEAFYFLGVAFWNARHIIASRACFAVHFRLQIDRMDDARGISALLEMNSSGGLPLLLKDDLQMQDCPRNVPWEAAFNQAMEEANALRWRKSLRLFQELLPKTDNHPAVLYNVAVLKGWLGDTYGMVSDLRHYATLDVPEEEAVEALALTNVLDHNHPDDQVNRMRLQYELEDAESLVEHLSENPSLVKLPFESNEVALDNEEVPAIANFLLLDRPVFDDLQENLTLKDMPNIYGIVSIFGKETDRSGRAIFQLTQDENYSNAIDCLQETAGDFLGEATEEIVGTIDRTYNAMAPRWNIHDPSVCLLRDAIMQEQRFEAIANIWPTIPQHALGGISPEAAAKDPSRRIELLAALLVLSTTSLADNSPEAVEALRKKLGIDPPSAIDPTDDDCHVRSIPLHRIPRIMTDKLTDDDLVYFYRHAKIACVPTAILPILRESVKRPSMKDRIDIFEAFNDLIQRKSDSEHVFDLLKEARAATSHDELAEKIDVAWDLVELVLQITHTNPIGVKDILDHISKEHLGMPNVGAAVQQILETHGLVPAGMGVAQGLPHTSFPGSDQQANAPSRLWTPGQSEAAAPQEEKPTLWTP